MAIINRTWNFVFVHIPKAGGTSMAHALSPLSTWQDLQLGGTEFGEQVHRAYSAKFGLSKHSFANELRNVVGHQTWATMTSFALVRHPVARTISTFRYLRHHRDHYKFMADVETFDAFLSAEFWRLPGPDRMFLPQTKWLIHPNPKTGRLVDCVVRLEEVTSELPSILQKIGIPPTKLDTLAFDQKNASPKRQDVVVTDEHLAIIEERYREDFETFGYDFELVKPSVAVNAGHV